MRVLTKWLRLELRGFRYKVALYLSNLHIKFDDKTKGNPSNFKHTFPFACVQSQMGVYRFEFICSQISRLLRLVTQIYDNQRTFDK